MELEDDARGIVGSLFDLSFHRFVTARLIPILYSLGALLAALFALAVAARGFSVGFIAGIWALIVAAVSFAFYLMCLRVALEVLIVVFRIEENTRGLAPETTGGPNRGPDTKPGP